MRKKIYIISIIILILGIGIASLFFIITKKEKNEEEIRIPLIEEQLFHEETIYPQEPSLLPQDQTLLKERGKKDIFWFQNQKLYLVLNAEIIELMKGIPGWQKINEFPPDTLKDYFQGPDFIASDSRSDGLLIKMKGTDYVFLMNQGKREYLLPEEFQARDYDPKDIIVVSTKIIKMLPPAPPVDHLSLQEAVKRGGIELIGSGKYFEEGIVFIAGPYEENTAINIEKGDVLLSKAGRQSLVVTQDFEVFVPKEQKITLEGLWVACIDRFKDWPRKGEKLDVTLNLRDWKLKSAFQLFELIKLIDKKGLNREQFSQEAIWKITDNEPVGERARKLLEEAGIDPDERVSFLHLSNPNPLSKTSFVLPPELSLLGLTASYIENCPQKGEEADKIICQEEIESAMKFYLTREIFPGTVEQKIDSKVITLLLSFYLTQKPIDETLPPLSQEEINNIALNLVNSLKQKGLKLPALEIEAIELLPSYIVEQESVLFDVKGQGIQDIKIKVFNLEGEQVFESERVFGNLFEWKIRDNRGELLSNGFYSYIIEARGFKGEVLKSSKRQLIIRL